MLEILNIYSQKWNCAALLPISTVMYWEQFIIPTIGHIWGLYFPVFCERTLGSTAGALRGAGNCHQVEVGGSSLPSPPLLRLSREFHKWPNDQHMYKFSIWKITDHKWKQLILVVIFLFAFRVNEIQNKTFILNSHRPFICNASATAPLVQLPQAQTLKVHKIENFFDSDFGICIISLIVMSKY